MPDNAIKKLLLIATGGTIASVDKGSGLAPAQNAGELLGALELPDCDVTAIDLLDTDSSNMQPEDWVTIANAVIQRADDYDGIVITHGTDTMAYTASALSFMLLGIKIPVIITGSQLPMSREGTDAARNLTDAFAAACLRALHGVYIVFCGRIIKGCRACKVSAEAFDAFRSINSADSGSVRQGVITLDDSLLFPDAGQDYRPVADNRVFLVKLVSGFDPKVLNMAALMDYRAVIIEGFGAGGVPVAGRSILPELKMLTEKGVLVAVTTQCIDGACNMSIYEVGRKALEQGAVATGSMSIEALAAKLMWIIGQVESREQAAHMLMTNYCGEF